MSYLSQEAKAAIVKKVLTQTDTPWYNLAAKYKVSRSSLYRWIKQYGDGKLLEIVSNNKVAPPLTRVVQLEHILATSTLDAQALGVYCREKGLYTTQIEEWKKEMTKPDETQKMQTLLSELKTLRIENKELKQDIRRKEKALAETTALLVLKKKAHLLLGEPGDN